MIKIVIILRENESHMAKNLVFDGGDASENCDFQRGKQRLQGAKFSNITKWHYFLDEPNLKLKNKTCQEISKITKWHYFLDELNLKFKTKHVIIIFDKYIFWDSWQNWLILAVIRSDVFGFSLLCGSGTTTTWRSGWCSRSKKKS